MGGVTSRNAPLLVDTHVLLWMLTDPTRLSTQASEALRRRAVPILVSAASAWEVATMRRLGKLPEADVLVHGYTHHLERLGVAELPIQSEHALLAGSLEWSNRDPFDRMLVAQCIVEGLPLVSADSAFATLAGIRVIW